MESGIVKSVVGFKPGVRVGEQEIFLYYKTSGAQPVSYSTGTGSSSPESKAARGAKLTTNLRLAPRIRMKGAIPLLLLYTFKAHSNLSPPTSEDNFSHACPKDVVHSG